MKLLTIKNRISKKKIIFSLKLEKPSVDRINSRLHTSDEIISELEVCSEEIAQNATERLRNGKDERKL